jgi:competence protein ComEA
MKENLPANPKAADTTSADSVSRQPAGAHLLLRRSDQAAVAVLVLVALAAVVAWWLYYGGSRDQLVEIDQAPPQTAAFQVDVNQADWPELAQLPGIGPTLARRIIESRQTDGPFQNHDDLQRVRGIGPKTLDKLRPYLLPMPASDPLADQQPPAQSPIPSPQSPNGSN